jgi:hypothetical protein
MGEGYSFETYHNWAFFVPLLIGLVAILVSLLVLCCVHPCMVDKRYYMGFVNFSYMYSKVIFRGALRRIDSEKKFVLYDCEIARWHIVHFFLVTTVTLYCVFVVFWASFLVDETFVCDHTHDCFVKRENNNISADNRVYTMFGIYKISPYLPIQRELVQDCDLIDGELMCFQFVYNISAGIMSALRFLAVVTFYIGTCRYVFKWLISCIGPSLCLVLAFLSVIGIPLLCSVLTLLVMTFIDFDFTYYSALNYFAYWFSLAFVGPVAALYFISLTCTMEDETQEVMIDLFLPLSSLMYLVLSLPMYGQLYAHTF